MLHFDLRKFLTETLQHQRFDIRLQAARHANSSFLVGQFDYLRQVSANFDGLSMRRARNKRHYAETNGRA
jgi:hypothetical protein